MIFKTLMSIKAIICLLFCISFVLIPMPITAYYGMAPGIHGRLMTLFFGQAFFLIGLLLWLARNIAKYNDQKPFIIAIFIGDMI